MAAINECPWKGNVKLSENTGNNIELDLVSVEKHHIQKVLQHTNGYKPEAARPLGIALTTLYRKMEPMDYNVEHFVLALPGRFT